MERLDLTASRNETWQPTIDYAYSGEPLALTGAELAMQWRLYEGAPGLPLIDLANVLFEDIEATEDDIALGVARAGDRILRLFPLIEQAELSPLPTGLNQPEPGEADRYAYDVIIAYVDGVTERIYGGNIYLEQGVTT